MSIGLPFANPNTSGIALSGVNTSTATNTTFPVPCGADIWVVNQNSSAPAYVFFSTNPANSTATPANGVPVPANGGMTMRAPWTPGYTGTAIISAILATGGNTGAVLAVAGFGTGN
jgi:hypothetical protein